MGGRKFTREEEEKMWELQQSGKIQKEIAAELGRSPGSISRVLARIEKRKNRSEAQKRRAEEPGKMPYISRLKKENDTLKSILWDQVAAGNFKIVNSKTGETVLE